VTSASSLTLPSSQPIVNTVITISSLAHNFQIHLQENYKTHNMNQHIKHVKFTPHNLRDCTTTSVIKMPGEHKG